MGIRANNRPRLNPGPFQNTHGTDENAIRNIRIANHAVGANPAIAPNACVTENLYERLDGRIGADLNFTINHTGLRRQNCDPFRHKLPAFGQTQALINIYQFGSHVAAQNLVGIVCLNRDHALFRLTQNGRHIREIKLSVRVIRAELVDMREQCFNRKSIKTGVDLANFLLFGRSRFLLYDRLHIIAFRALANYTPIAGRISDYGGQNGHRGFFAGMKIAQLRDRFGRNQRRVAGEDNNLIVVRESVARHHECVPSAALWSLQHEIDSSMGNGLAHTLGFVADDGVDILGRDHFRRGSDNVRKQRFAANFVQHFRMFRFQPRAFTRSHDGDRHPLRALTPALRM